MAPSPKVSLRLGAARLAAVGALVASSFLYAVAPAHAVSIISTTGPLTNVTTTPDLNCAVNHIGDDYGEWYSDLACATLVAHGGDLYGPASIPAGGPATSVTGYTAYTPVSQSAVTGSGTATDPFTIVTVVRLATSGLTLTQTDSYIAGQESYRTTVELSSTASTDRTAIIYRAGDCYLQDSDTGLGGLLGGNQPVCKAHPSSADPNRVEGFYPLTNGSRYMEGRYSAVWAAIGSKTPLPNTVRDDPTDLHDNGIALSWNVTVPAGGSVAVSAISFFSPVGAAPVTLRKTVDQPTPQANATLAYTITATNPGATVARLTTIRDTLPTGFTYVPGSTSGATSSDPSIASGALAWSGPFDVPANGSISLTFRAKAPNVNGTFTNSAYGSCDACSVVDAVDTAPVTLTGGVTTEPSPSTSASPSPSPSPSTSPSPSPSPSTSTSPSPSPTTSVSPSPSQSWSPTTQPSASNRPTTAHAKRPIRYPHKTTHGGLARTGADAW